MQAKQDKTSNYKISSTVTFYGTDSLHITQTTSYFNGTTKSYMETVEKDFPMQQITEAELLRYRLYGKPGFVLKSNDNYYYTEIPKDLRFIACNTLLGGHCCRNCRRLSAASDADGGCEKVRNASILYYKEYSNRKAIELSQRIEKYDFITFGFESFNTLHDALIVIECDHYESSRNK